MVDLNNFTLKVGDKVIVSDRKMADHKREGEIVGIEDKTDENQYLVFLNETTVKRPKLSAEIDVKLDSKTNLFLKGQLRKKDV